MGVWGAYSTLTNPQEKRAPRVKKMGKFNSVGTFLALVIAPHNVIDLVQKRRSKKKGTNLPRVVGPQKPACGLEHMRDFDTKKGREGKGQGYLREPPKRPDGPKP